MVGNAVTTWQYRRLDGRMVGEAIIMYTHCTVLVYDGEVVAGWGIRSFALLLKIATAIGFCLS